MKPWKRDLAHIREVGPDEPRFDEAVQRVWDRIEELEAALREIAEQDQPEVIRNRYVNIAREALS